MDFRVKLEEGEEGEAASDEEYGDHMRDDELDHILQQTVPLGVQLRASKLSVNFTSLPEEPPKDNMNDDDMINTNAEIFPQPQQMHENLEHHKEKSESEHQQPPKEKTELQHTHKEKEKAESSKILPLEALLKRDRPVRYFVMKCSTSENLSVALDKHIWSTQPHNEKKLRDAYQDNEVILIFSVNSSGAFQGYARMVSGIGTKSSKIWVQDSTKWGGLFYLEWMCVKEVGFAKVSHLVNPLNENKQVKVSRDGQELQQIVGFQLCKILDSGREIDTDNMQQSYRATDQKKSHTNSERQEMKIDRHRGDNRHGGPNYNGNNAPHFNPVHPLITTGPYNNYQFQPALMRPVVGYPQCDNRAPPGYAFVELPGPRGPTARDYERRHDGRGEVRFPSGPMDDNRRNGSKMLHQRERNSNQPYNDRHDRERSNSSRNRSNNYK
jgi:hypothetical protein